MNGRPLGITLVALVLAISGVFQVVVGTEALGYTHFGLGAAADAAGISGWASIISGVLSILVGLGLFTLAGWAYTLVVVVLVIRILVDLWAIVTHGATSTLGIGGITNLVISGLILLYFRSGGVKAAFGR